MPGALRCRGAGVKYARAWWWWWVFKVSSRANQGPSSSCFQVFEYNGTNASGLSKGQEEPFYPTYDLAGFSWQIVNQTALMAKFQGMNTVDPGGTSHNGTISFQVRQPSPASRPSQGRGLLLLADQGCDPMPIESEVRLPKSSG